MIAADAALVDLARAGGGDVRGIDDLSLPELKAAEVIVIGPTQAWDRVRAWRVAGVVVGVVVVGGVAPEDRTRLEPVMILARPEPHAFAVARERLAVAELSGQVVLRGAVADLHRSVVRRTGQPEERLTGLEARLLGYLAARAPRVVGREELQEQVWDHRQPLETRTVEVTVGRLRKKLEVDPSRPVSLLTVRGSGYRVVREEGAGPQRPVAAPVGRDDLLASLSAEARTGGITTLYGAPGVGKSTVLRALARTLGAAVVDLDGAPEDPWTALAVGLRAPQPQRGDRAESLIAALAASGRTHLCIDHADRHLAALVGVAQVLVDRGIGVVTTSRRMPGWVGSRVREVPPLAEDSAVALLADRSGVSGAALAGIVRRLDHLPLAIELVAPRVSALGPEVLLETLDRHGTLWLAGDGHRHGSVRATVAWSFAGLTPADTRRMARLSVLQAPFEPAFATEATGVSALELLALVEASLVVGDDRRFRLLHAVREFARESSPDELAETVPTWVAAVARRAEDELRTLETLEGQAALERLREALPELRAVIELGPPGPDPQRVAAVLAVERVLAVHGSFDERVALLAAWTEATAASPALHGRVALRLHGARFHGDRDASLARLDALAETVGAHDPVLRAQILLQSAVFASAHLGPAAVMTRLSAFDPRLLSTGDALRADAFALRARTKLGELDRDEQVHRLQAIVEQLVEAGLPGRAAEVAIRLGDALLGQDTTRAEAMLRPVAAFVDRCVDPTLQCSVFVALALAEGDLGRTTEALAHLERAETAIRHVDPVRRWLVEHSRGRVWLAGDHLDEARAVLASCLHWWETHGWDSGAYDQLEQLVIVELLAARPGEALRWARQALGLARGLDAAVLAEAAAWVTAAAAADGAADEARAAAREVDPGLLPPDRRLVFFAACLRAERLDGGDDRPVADHVEQLRRRVPAAHPVRRVAEGLLLDLA